MREIWAKIGFTSGAKGYGLLAAVAIVSITARFLGPEGRGQLAVIGSWATAFATFAHLSLGQVALHRAAEKRSAAWLDEALPILLCWCAIASVIAWCSAILVYWLTGGRPFAGIERGALALGFLMIPLIIWEQYGSSLLLAVGRLGLANRFQVIGRTVSLVGVTGSMLAGLGIVSVLVSSGVGQLVVAAGGLRGLLKGVQLKVSSQSIRSYLGAGFQLHFNAVGAFLFSAADIVILNYYHGPGETGYYQIGLQVITVMMVVPQAASTVLYARVAELGPDGAWSAQRVVLVNTLGLMLLIGAAAWFAAPWIIGAIGGSAFAASVEVFRWQVFSIVGMSLSAIMAPQWVGRGYFRLASTLTLAIGVVSVAMTLWLVPKYGKFGAAWSNVITYGVATLGNGTFALWCELKSRSYQEKLLHS